MSTGTSSPSCFSASVIDLEVGFFAREAFAPNPQFVFRRVDDLATPVQYFRVQVTLAQRDALEVWVVAAAPSSGRATLALHPAPTPGEVDSLEARIRATLPDALLALWLSDREGHAVVSAPSIHAPAVAATVASVKYYAGWDESDPIIVELSPNRFAVSVTHAHGVYHASVRRIETR